MTVFAQVQKRLQKRKREDETGVTELKEALGLATGGSEDSEEEGTGSSESEDSEEGEEDREDSSGDEEEGSGEEDEDEEEEADDSDGEGDEDEDEDVQDLEEPPFTLTTEKAVAEPIYLKYFDDPPRLSRTCVLCPGRELRNESTEKDHLRSKIHTRFAHRFLLRLSSSDLPPPSSDPRVVVSELQQQLKIGIFAVSKTPEEIEAVKTQAVAKKEKKAERKRRQREAKVKRRAKKARQAVDGGPGAGEDPRPGSGISQSSIGPNGRGGMVMGGRNTGRGKKAKVGKAGQKISTLDAPKKQPKEKKYAEQKAKRAAYKAQKEASGRI